MHTFALRGFVVLSFDLQRTTLIELAVSNTLSSFININVFFCFIGIAMGKSVSKSCWYRERV
jgi:hypothetical protein